MYKYISSQKRKSTVVKNTFFYPNLLIKGKGQTQTKRTALLVFLFQLFHRASTNHHCLPLFHVPNCHRTRQDNLLTGQGGIARQLVLLACGPLHRASKCSSACFSASPPPCPSVIAHPWTTTYPPFNLTSTFSVLHNVTTCKIDHLKFCIHQWFDETFCL